MCWRCDDPTAGEADYRGMVATTIDRYGWMIQGVEGDAVVPEWAYTVGLTDFHLPELVALDTPLQDAHALLNSVALDLTAGTLDGHLDAGDRIIGPDGRRLEAVDFPHPELSLFVAVDMFGARIRALELRRLP